MTRQAHDVQWRRRHADTPHLSAEDQLGYYEVRPTRPGRSSFLTESTATHRGDMLARRVHPSDPGALSINMGRPAESQGRRLPEFPPAHASTLYWYGARTHPTCDSRNRFVSAARP